MAETWSDQGLDWLLSLVPKAGTVPATLYAGLFTSATPTTVPATTAVLSTYTGVTEASFPGYARQPITAASWGAVGAKTTWGQTGRGVTAAQLSFPAATGAYETQINGFFVATDLAHGSEIGIWYSNFDDEVEIATMAVGDIVKVTPTWAFLH